MAALLVLAACSQPKQEELRIGTHIWPGYEPLFLARTMGAYKGDDIRLVELSSATELIRAYRNGVLDGATVTLDEAILLAQSHLDFKIMLIMDYSNGGDVILARPPIDSLEELRGKRVGFENTALGSYVIARALEIADIPFDAIKVVPLNVDEHEHAYVTGQVDAVVTFEPVRTRLLQLGANQIFDSRQMPKEIVDVLIVRNTVIEQRPQAVRKLLAGWFKALALIDKEPARAHRIMAERLGITPQETAASYEGLLLPQLDENKQQLFGSPPALLQTVHRLAEKMVGTGILSRTRDYKALFMSRKGLDLYP